jgi:hypothetical protein
MHSNSEPATRHYPLGTLLKFFLFTSLRTLLRFCALRKNSTLFFSCSRRKSLLAGETMQQLIATDPLTRVASISAAVAASRETVISKLINNMSMFYRAAFDEGSFIHEQIFL